MTFARNYTEDREKRQQERAERIAKQRPPKSLHTGVYAGDVRPIAPKPKVAREQKVRQPIRDSARGEDCLMQLPGVCHNDRETVIWSHARWPEAGKGGATKSLDLAGCYACTACDAVFDGNVRMPVWLSREEVDHTWHMAHLKSLVRLAEKGLL